MKTKLTKHSIYLILGTSIVLFFVNNILFGAIVPRLPGGSATGISTMMAITWLSLNLKQFGAIPIVFLIYVLISLPSHLAVGDTNYFLAIILLIVPAIMFDFLLKLKQYKIESYILSFPIFVLMVAFSAKYLHFLDSGDWNLPDLKDTGMNLILGYAGICGGYLIFKIQQNRKQKNSGQ